MRDEISAAVHFLARLIGKSENFNQKLLEDFKACLSELLEERFENHWFPDQPCKGQGYRCIRVNGYDRRDATLEQAARTCGIKYEDMKLPIELTIWVDPNEVCCRFGESKGSYCTLASFMDKENNASCGSVSSGDESEAGSEETEAIQLSPPMPLAQQTANENKIQTAVLGGSNNNRTSSGGGRKGRSKSGGARRHNTTNNNSGGGFLHPMQSWYNVLPHQWLPPSPPPYHPMLRTHHFPPHPHHRYQWSTLKA